MSVKNDAKDGWDGALRDRAGLEQQRHPAGEGRRHRDAGGGRMAAHAAGLIL